MDESNDCICPITLRVFREPIVAADGHFYEKYALTQCVENSSKSPLTGLVINNIMISCVLSHQHVKKLFDCTPLMH
jgi:hypothetical protein